MNRFDLFVSALAAVVIVFVLVGGGNGVRRCILFHTGECFRCRSFLSWKTTKVAFVVQVAVLVHDRLIFFDQFWFFCESFNKSDNWIRWCLFAVKGKTGVHALPVWLWLLDCTMHLGRAVDAALPCLLLTDDDENAKAVFPILDKTAAATAFSLVSCF